MSECSALHLLVVKKVEVESNEISWQWLAPKRFTIIEHRYVGQSRMACATGAWHAPAESTKALPFNKDEILALHGKPLTVRNFGKFLVSNIKS